MKRLLMRLLGIPSDVRADRYPVSVKGVVFIGKKVVLLKNEREEWELPGGKLEPAEKPEECVVREIAEELNLPVALVDIVDTWMYTILNAVTVFIVTYHCRPTVEDINSLRISHEHKELGLFSVDEVAGLVMPDGYKQSIYRAWKRHER